MLYIISVIDITASFKGEAQGTFRRVPHPPPLKPLSATPPSGSLSGVRVMKLAFRKLFFSRNNILVLVFVYPNRFLIYKPLKTDNSASPQTISFLNGAFY